MRVHRLLLIFLLLASSFGICLDQRSAITRNSLTVQDQIPHSLYLNLTVKPERKTELVRQALEAQLKRTGVYVTSDDTHADAEASIVISVEFIAADKANAKQYSSWPERSKLLVNAIDSFKPKIIANYRSGMGAIRSGNFFERLAPPQDRFLNEDDAFRMAGDNAGRQLRWLMRENIDKVKDVFIYSGGQDQYLQLLRKQLGEKISRAGYQLVSDEAHADARITSVLNVSRDGSKYDIVYMYDVALTDGGPSISLASGYGESSKAPESAISAISDQIAKKFQMNSKKE